MANDLAETLRTLKARRAQAMARVELLDEAIGALSRIANGDGDQAEPAPTSSHRRRAPRGEGIRTAVVELARETFPQDWSAHEVLAEFKRRGEPIYAQDPMNAVRSALARAAKDGLLVRTQPGRYQAQAASVTHIAPSEPDSVLHAPDHGGVRHPQPEEVAT